MRKNIMVMWHTPKHKLYGIRYSLVCYTVDGLHISFLTETYQLEDLYEEMSQQCAENGYQFYRGYPLEAV